MPTPFTHLRTAQELLRDDSLPEAVRTLLETERSAFLLGNIAADARVNSGINRADTHFYTYDEPLRDHAWRVMLERHPSLQTSTGQAQRVFLAGYVAHLAMDEIWLVDLLREHFFDASWRDSKSRFLMLHFLLTQIDERDHDLLEAWHAPVLKKALPRNWLPFMSDANLLDWRDFIHEQLVKGSQTVEVLSKRVKKTPAEFRAVLDSPERMTQDLWAFVPPAVVEKVEAKMYTFAREQLNIYWAEFN